jgi:hypothetical protein
VNSPNEPKNIKYYKTKPEPESNEPTKGKLNRIKTTLRHDLSIADKINKNQDSSNSASKNKIRKTLLWFCGIESIIGRPQNVQQINNIDTSINEKRQWVIVTNILAILVASFVGFNYAFFNFYN